MTLHNAAPALGLDFGTSNSTVGVLRDGGHVTLVPLEGDKPVLPSAVFFDTDGGPTQFGTAAIESYVDGMDGRLIRAFKGVLGTDLIHEDTMIGTRRIAFTDIIGRYIGHMKARAQGFFGQGFDCVVAGRPVCYVDDDPAADRMAVGIMADILRSLGFAHIEFQFEPIAAALEYESGLASEETAMVIDIGGGTTDVTVIRLSPDRHGRPDRGADILANLGLRLGGTDFDRLLSMASVMPALGYRAPLKQESAVMPLVYYHRLSDWKQINSLYLPRTLSDIKALARQAQDPAPVLALAQVVERRLGHDIALRVERAKIALSTAPQAVMPFADILGSDLTVTAAQFHDAIEDRLSALDRLIAAALAQSGLKSGDLDTIFYTGGSSQIPVIRARIAAQLPDAKVVHGDAHAAVGRGLCRDAGARFGGLAAA